LKDGVELFNADHSTQRWGQHFWALYLSTDSDINIVLWTTPGNQFRAQISSQKYKKNYSKKLLVAIQKGSFLKSTLGRSAPKIYIYQVLRYDL
jgi:hypothetical protein